MKKILYILIPILVVAGALYFYSFANATDSGPNDPGTLADDATVGTVAWSNPTNAGASDDTYATVELTQPEISHYLKTTNFGFSIPTGAVINGILVEVERTSTDSGGRIGDREVKIIKSDGTIGTENKAVTSGWWAIGDNIISYGNSTDLWSETWTAEDINDVDFGVAFAAENDGGGIDTAKVDHIRITVTYTEAVVTSAQRVQVKSGKLEVKSGKLELK